MARNPSNLGFLVTQCDTNPIPLVLQYGINSNPMITRDTTNFDSNITRSINGLDINANHDLNSTLSEYRVLESQRSQSYEALKRRILKRRANLELAVEFENQFVKKTKAGKVVCIPAHHIYLRMGQFFF